MDPDGADIYRYDDKSGTFHLYQKNDDEFDQIARFKYQSWSTDDVSVEGFERFIIEYSDMVGREMGGYYYTEIGGTDIKYINSGMGKNNTRTTSYPGPGIFRVRADLYGRVAPHTNWHTPIKCREQVEAIR